MAKTEYGIAEDNIIELTEYYLAHGYDKIKGWEEFDTILNFLLPYWSKKYEQLIEFNKIKREAKFLYKKIDQLNKELDEMKNGKI